MPLLESAYGTALRFTQNPSDAEDLVQEAVLLAFRGFSQFQPGTNFRGWFFRILANAFFSKYRRERRQGAAVDLDDVPELYLYTQTEALGLHQRTDDPARVLMDRLDTEAIESALAALPDEYRMAATLYFLQDMGYREIADVLSIPVGTVRSRLHRARRLLQKALWDVAEERGITRTLAQSEAS